MLVIDDIDKYLCSTMKALLSNINLSFLFEMIACVLYLTVTLLLHIRIKQHEWVQGTSVRATSLMASSLALSALFYLGCVVTSMMPLGAEDEYRQEESLVRLLLVHLPLLCVLGIPIANRGFRIWLVKGGVVSLLVGWALWLTVAALLGKIQTGGDAFKLLLKSSYITCFLVELLLMCIMKKYIDKLKEAGKKNLMAVFRVCIVLFCLLGSFVFGAILLHWYFVASIYTLVGLVINCILVQIMVSKGGEFLYNDDLMWQWPVAHSDTPVHMLCETEHGVQCLYETLYKKLEQYMEKEHPYLKTKITREQVAAAIGTNTTYLSRTLNRKAHMSFKKYITLYRIKHVQDSFQADTSKRIIDLCYKSGFSSQSALNQAFRTHLGITPGEWCKKYRKEKNSNNGLSASK